MPRACPTPTAPSIASPSPSASATCRASSVALGEMYRVLKIGGRFLCLEFSSVDVPGVDKLYDLYSFQVIPRVGQAVTGDRDAYQYLVESIRKFPKPKVFAQMIERGRLPPRVGDADDRRRGGAAFGLAFVIGGFSHLVRLGRAGFVFAREDVFALVDTRPLPLPARAAISVRAAVRAAERQEPAKAGSPPR